MSQAGRREFGFSEQERQGQSGGTTSRMGQGSGPQQSSTGAAGVMETAKETARDWASTAASKAENAWETTRQSAQQFGSTVAHTAGDAWDGFEGFIRRYPVPSLLCAFAVGFMVAGAFGYMAISNGGRDRWS
jgi:ElaB/YqjD/DUF883 family membrane-anchored ribosome-binding protein